MSTQAGLAGLPARTPGSGCAWTFSPSTPPELAEATVEDVARAAATLPGAGAGGHGRARRRRAGGDQPLAALTPVEQDAWPTVAFPGKARCPRSADAHFPGECGTGCRRWLGLLWTGRRTGGLTLPGWPRRGSAPGCWWWTSARAGGRTGPAGAARWSGRGPAAWSSSSSPRSLRRDADRAVLPRRGHRRHAGLRGDRRRCRSCRAPGRRACARSGTCSATGTPGIFTTARRIGQLACPAPRTHRPPACPRRRRGRLVAGGRGGRPALAAHRSGDDRAGARRRGRSGRALPARQQRRLAAHPGAGGGSPAWPATSSRVSRPRRPWSGRSAEEVGVEVGRIEYVGSQAWPFPGSLMLGFTALRRPEAAAADRSGRDRGGALVHPAGDRRGARR